MTQTQPKPVVRLGTVAEVAESMPYVLGYQPVERLVVVSLVDRMVGLVASALLDDADEHGVDPYARGIMQSLRQQEGTTGVLLVVFSESERLELATRVQVLLGQAGLAVRDLIYVMDGRAASLLTVEAAEEVRLSEKSAQFAAVLGPIGREQDLLDPLTPATLTAEQVGEVMAALTRTSARVRAEDKALAAELTEFLLSTEAVSLTVAGTMLGALRDVAIRDQALYLLLDVDQRQTVMDRAAWLAQLVPGRLRTAPVALWAIGQYLNGHGTAFRLAAEQALQVEPDYALLRMVKAGYEMSLPPEAVKSILAEAAADQG